MEQLLKLSSLKLWLLLFSVLMVRYLIVAGIPYLWLYVIRRKQLKGMKIQEKYPNRKQMLNEVKYSTITLFIYSSGIWVFLYWLRNGYTKNYTEISEFGWPYFIFSIFLMIIVHDAYSYWVHRLIHHKTLFKHVHLLHHSFKNPSPWSAFAFHPFESLLTMGIIPIILFLIPWHNLALIVFITGIIFYDTFVHLGYNIKQLKLFKYQNTPLDHDIHHRNSKYNFGLYFTIWDRIMGTYLKSNESLTE